LSASNKGVIRETGSVHLRKGKGNVPDETVTLAINSDFEPSRNNPVALLGVAPSKRRRSARGL